MENKHSNMNVGSAGQSGKSNFFSILRAAQQVAPTILLAHSLCFASGAGTTGAPILKLGVGARALAMGEAYTALADDASSLYWNPAGLGLLSRSHASFMHTPFIEDQSFSNVEIGVPLQSGGIGAMASYLNHGSIQGYNDSDQAIGKSSAYSAVLGVGGAWSTDQFSYGLGLKSIQSKIADVNATTYAGDLGVTYIYPKTILGGSVRAAATYRHLGKGMKFISQTDPLPSEWRVGVAGSGLLNKRLNIGLDVARSNDEQQTIAFGTEWWMHRSIALRLGYLKNDVEGVGIRTGIGLKVGSFMFDYALASLGDLGLTHRYEVGFLFGEERTQLLPEERKLLQQAKDSYKHRKYEEAVLYLDELIRRTPNYKPAYRLTRLAIAKSESQQRKIREARDNELIKQMETAQKAPEPDKAEMDSLMVLGETKPTQNVALPKPISSAEGRNLDEEVLP